jgi:hypothetical protein
MEIRVSIPADNEGYTGRECPVCKKYFKIKFGTGLPNSSSCHCPYCNHIGSQQEFWTKQQIEYARSIALHNVSNQLLQSLKQLEMAPRHDQLFSIGISVSGSPTPIVYYSEIELEQKIVCQNCTLAYTIYGVFGYCPDCGIHNSKQITDTNFSLILNMLDLPFKEVTAVISEKIVENALEDIVSTFDAFGREWASKLKMDLSFQNIEKARKKLVNEIDFNIADGIDLAEWNFIVEQFQKRHLLAHKMGVIDDAYIKNTGADYSMIGRKVVIKTDEVKRLIKDLNIISSNLFKHAN